MRIPSPPTQCPKCGQQGHFWLEGVRASNSGAIVQVLARWRCGALECAHVVAVERTQTTW